MPVFQQYLFDSFGVIVMLWISLSWHGSEKPAIDVHSSGFVVGIAVGVNVNNIGFAVGLLVQRHGLSSDDSFDSLDAPRLIIGNKHDNMM